MDLLPASYKPFPELVLCSNVFMNVTIPIGINGNPMVLIGRGDVTPLVWIAGPSRPSSNQWVFMVKESRVINPGIELKWIEDSCTLVLNVLNLEVLRVKADNTRAVVSVLDLRPFGLNVTGSSDGLQIGTNTFQRNNLGNAKVGLNLTVPDAKFVDT